MSRCLSFPPPGYEDLIELIKVRREEAEVEKQKKERKEEEERGEIRKKRNSHHRSHKRRKSNNGNNGRRHKSCCDTKKDLELEEEELEEGEIRQERNNHHRRHTRHRSYSERGLQDIESTFRELFARWAPPPTTSEHLESESIEWLFGEKAKRQPRTNLSEAFNARSYELCHSSSAKFPTAQYLPQADIHALPFKIPF